MGGGITVTYVHTDHLNTPRAITRPSDNAVLWLDSVQGCTDGLAARGREASQSRASGSTTLDEGRMPERSSPMTSQSDPFGTTLANEDPDGDGIPLRYYPRFPGQFYDASSELHYNYFRDYDPAVGRYVESDPIGLLGGINTYGYVGQAPIVSTDTTGLAGPAAAAGLCFVPGIGWLGCGAVAVVGGGVLCVATGACQKAIEGVGDAIAEMCRDKACPPCKTASGKVVPVGTVAYRPLDTPPPGKVEHGITGPHYNLYKANQNPSNCKCFWQPIDAVPQGGLPPDAIPIEPFVN